MADVDAYQPAAIQGIFNVANLGRCLILMNGTALYFGPNYAIQMDGKMAYLTRAGEITPISIINGAQNKASVYSAFGNIDYEQYEICNWGGLQNASAKIIYDRAARKYIWKN